MLEFLTGDDIYSHILMSRTVDNRLFLVVEGPDDYPFISARVRTDEISVIPAHGRGNVTRVAEITEQKGDRNVMALRDRDFSDILGPDPTTSWLTCTDDYDLDATLLQRTSAAQSVALTFSDPDVRTRHMQSTGESDVAELVRRAVAEIGYLRLISQRQSLNLSLARFPVHDILEVTTCKVDERQLVQIANARSPYCGESDTAILSMLQAERLVVPNSRVVCGHDAGSALALLISRAWGGHTNSARVVLSAIRAAVSSAQFLALDFVKRIDDWAVGVGRTGAWAS